MQDYTKQELEQLHAKNLEMAKYFVKICEENNLLCYFCGGGCIGAVRHGGFIPWDDDLDFFMPRTDYEKLEHIWKEKADTERYSINRPGSGYCDHNSMITIKDEQTTFIKPYQQDLDISHGLPLDIFPLDGYAPGTFKRKMQMCYALIYSLFATQVLPEKHGKGMKIICSLLLKMVPSKKMRYRLWHFCEKRMSRFAFDKSEFITELCAGPHYMKKKYPAECFKEKVYFQFENTQMPIPKGYDIYLKTAFGDYMQLPPKEKQKAHHECVFMDLEHSYKDYKGVHYCKK